jgi:hypothetical protein
VASQFKIIHKMNMPILPLRSSNRIKKKHGSMRISKTFPTMKTIIYDVPSTNVLIRDNINGQPKTLSLLTYDINEICHDKSISLNLRSNNYLIVKD